MGSDKAMLRVGGQTLIERTLDILAALFDEILVVGRPLPPSLLTRHAARGTHQIPDAIPCAGPLGGIYTGLLTMAKPWGFFVACDMPCLDADVIRRQLDVVQGTDADAVVPCWTCPERSRRDGYWEPLHAAYSQDCLPAARRQIEKGDLRIRGFYNEVNVLFWDILAAGLSPRAFTNVNTKSDLAALLGLP